MNRLSFEIITSRDFLNKLKEDYADYQKIPNSSRLALNCALTSWHITEWIYKEYGLSSTYCELNNFKDFVKTECPSLQVMHDISDGSKHYQLTFRIPKVEKTEKHSGTFDNSFDFSYDRTMLQITMNNGEVLIFDDELKKIIIFWEDYLDSLKNI